MTQFRLLLLVCSGLLCIKPALAGNSLDALFDKETGHAAATPKANQPAHTTAKQKSKGLDDLLEQERAEEAHQRQLAEERRRAEEARQRQLAEDKRRRDEAQRLAEQRQREIDDERDAARRKRQDTVNAGMFGAALGFAAGNRNIGAAGLTQALTGEEADTGTLNQAYQSDLAEQKRKADEEARARDAEAARIERMHRQQEAEADRKVAQDTRQIEAYNRQQQQQRQQQADQQRQQDQQRQAQDQQRQQQAKAAEDQQYAIPYGNCLSVIQGGIWPALSNHCNFAVEAHWCQDGQTRPCTTYDSSWTIEAGGNHPITEGSARGQIHYAACREGAYIEKSGFNYRCHR